MRSILPTIILCFCGLMFIHSVSAQITVTPQTNATALAQRLVGNGVSIMNASFTGNTSMAGNFVNHGGNNINIDSGIVLTTGRARTVGGNIGVSGNGTTIAEIALASYGWFLPGDANLAAAIGVPTSNMRDACILEFDFIPLGDSIKFSYVFSSEEYDPSFVCEYNDAFAFFISGPGIVGQKNIALVPGTSIPVSIFNVNNVSHFDPADDCINNPAYYIDNTTNRHFTHDGHTTVLQALEKVQPCQVYHLKLVIADLLDDQFDSGVFLEARSLSSNIFNLAATTQYDPSLNNNYLVEGCLSGTVEIKREVVNSSSQTVFLEFAGTAINGVDVQTIPTSLLIPANQSSVTFQLNPIIDNLPEGIETLKIYTKPGCASSSFLPTDSIEIQIRDYDTLGIIPDSALICRNSSVQLQASTGYSSYIWDANSSLNNVNTASPIALPTDAQTMYYCTATLGDCNARDSAFIQFKDLEFLAQTDVICTGAETGQIQMASGPEWVGPVSWAINNGPQQSDSNFNNLPVGNYWVRITDAEGCSDSMEVNIIQSFPDLLSTIQTVPATCSGDPDGRIEVLGSGGNAPYTYSIDNGVNYQSANIFQVRLGTYDVVIKDANGCTRTEQVQVGFVNDLQVDAGVDETICEGTSVQLMASSNGTSFEWTPNLLITNSNTVNPVVSPIRNQKYYVKAIRGVCEVTDSIMINVRSAPLPNAGADMEICFGADTQLQATPGFSQYSWTPSNFLNNTGIATPNVIRPLDDIHYYLSVVDQFGCASLQHDTVKVRVTPPVEVFAGNDTVIGINQPLQLMVMDVNNSGINSWNWSPAYGLDNAFIDNPIALLDRDITYIVTGKTSANCEGSDTLKVKAYQGPEIYVPTGFTPNGDGLNDQIKAFAVGMRSTGYFKIYNRWGQEIFSTSDFTKGWDGRIKGSLQPIGSYVWVAQAIDFMGNVISRRGVFTLIQ